MKAELAWQTHMHSLVRDLFKLLQAQFMDSNKNVSPDKLAIPR